ncbi:hypothetical protein KY360_05115 [Candidatus Woesearchaeota archaeon]|nr:hypothetical protein [Candidatus Woesearchaeota archaeon]
MKIQKYLKQMKKGIFFDAFELIKKNPKLYLLMLLVDACFLLAGFLVGKAANFLVPSLLGSKNFFLALIVVLLYILLLILIYSFTKYYALHLVKSLLNKINLSLARIKKFYLLNVISIAILFVIVFAVSGIFKAGVKEAYVLGVSRTVILILFLFVFAFISIAHSLFALGFNVKAVLRNTFRLTFTRLNKYYGVLVVNSTILVLYTLIYYAVAKLLDLPLDLDVGRYNSLFVGMGFVLLYLLQAYNRIYFYLIVKRVKQK